MGARRPAGRAKGVMPSDEIHSTGNSHHQVGRRWGPKGGVTMAITGSTDPRLCRQPLRDAWDGHRDRTRDPRHRDRAHPMPHQLHHHRWFRWPKRRRRRQTHRHIRDHWKRDNCESGPYPRRRRCVGNRCHVQRRRAWLRPWSLAAVAEAMARTPTSLPAAQQSRSTLVRQLAQMVAPPPFNSRAAARPA